MVPAMAAAMKATVENLHALQQLQRQSAPAPAEREAQVRRLREKVPAQILAHFDRLIAQGRKGVALVRNGICGNCHLRVSSGTVASLVQPKDVYLCDSCGSYLLLMPEETAKPVAASTPVATKVRPARKKPATASV